MKKIKNPSIYYDKIDAYEAGDAGHTVVLVNSKEKVENSFEILNKRLCGLQVVAVIEGFSGTPCLYLTDGTDLYILESFNFKGEKEYTTELRILVDDND